MKGDREMRIRVFFQHKIQNTHNDISVSTRGASESLARLFLKETLADCYGFLRERLGVGDVVLGDG